MPRRSVSPSGSSATSGRSPGRITRERATGSAKCRPAEPRRASACHGSAVPVVITPAAPAAAATRTQAPRLPRWRGSSSAITGAGPGWATMPSGSSWRGRRATATTCARGTTAASSSSSTTVGVERDVRREPRAQSAASSSASAVQTPSSSAPKRTACLTAWKPSSTTSPGSRRAPRTSSSLIGAGSARGRSRPPARRAPRAGCRSPPSRAPSSVATASPSSTSHGVHVHADGPRDRLGHAEQRGQLERGDGRVELDRLAGSQRARRLEADRRLVVVDRPRAPPAEYERPRAAPDPRPSSPAPRDGCPTRTWRRRAHRARACPSAARSRAPRAGRPAGRDSPTVTRRAYVRRCDAAATGAPAGPAGRGRRRTWVLRRRRTPAGASGPSGGRRPLRGTSQAVASLGGKSGAGPRPRWESAAGPRVTGGRASRPRPKPRRRARRSGRGGRRPRGPCGACAVRWP